MDEMDEMDFVDTMDNTSISSIRSISSSLRCPPCQTAASMPPLPPPPSSSPAPSAFPLADVVGAWRRWGLAIVAFALAAGILGGALTALRPARYTCQATLIIDVEAQMELYAARMAAVFDAAVPSAMRAEIDRSAEAFVHLAGDRILDRDQTVEQYVTAWKANTLSALLANDAVVERLARRLGPRLEVAWPEAARDPARLRQWALRVHRDRPQSVVVLSFTAPDPDLARDGLAVVVETLLELEAAERQTLREDLLARARRQVRAAADILAQAPEAWPAPDSQTRRAAAQAMHVQAVEAVLRLESVPDLIERPLIALLADPAPPHRVGPRSGLAAARWLTAAALFALLATALFSGRPPRPCGPMPPQRDNAQL